jgi:hypothetical protein
MMAVPAPVFPVDPDPLPHGDLPRKLHVAVAQFRMFVEHLSRLFKQDPDTLLCDLFGRRVFGSLLHHELFPYSRFRVLCSRYLIMIRVGDRRKKEFVQTKYHQKFVFSFNFARVTSLKPDILRISAIREFITSGLQGVRQPVINRGSKP